MSEDNEEQEEQGEPRRLEAGVDYYLENGLMVFTGSFLQKRAYCCESGCRHCPYGYEKTGK